MKPNQFKQWRRKNSYSQEDVAFMLNLPVSTIQRFEAGVYGDIDIEELKKKKPLN